MAAWDVRVSPLTVGRGETLTVDVGSVERFQPMTRSTVRVLAHPDDPGGYAGEEVALHWTVSIRMFGTKPRHRQSRTRRIPISKLD